MIKAAIKRILTRRGPEPLRQYHPPEGDLFQACGQCVGPTRLLVKPVNGMETVICEDCGGRVLLLTEDDECTLVV